MLASPAQVEWPPERMAKSQFSRVKVPTADETSAEEVGETMQDGWTSASCAEK